MSLPGNKLQLRNLITKDFKEMHKAFNLAFSDYILPINLSFAQFEKRFLQKLAINFELSAGAFISDKLVGFIFTGIGTYEGKKVAYNGGTGVIPGFRGNNITRNLYNFLFPILKKNNIEACVLEVLTDNKKALQVYKSLNFQQTKVFNCFRKDFYENDDFQNPNIKNIKKAEDPDWDLFRSFSDHNPSFLDSFDVITRNIDNEQIVVYEIENTIIGYAIFQPELGRISQLAVDKNHRRKGVGTALIDYIIMNSQTIAVTVMNIESKNKDLLGFLNQSGFENQLNQYEMYLPLT